MLQIQEVRHTRGLEAHRRSWAALLRSAEDSDFFHTYEWVVTWLEHFWRDRPIAFLLGVQGDRLIAMAPLLGDGESGIWCRPSILLTNDEHDRRGALIHAGDPAPALDAMLIHLERTGRPVRLPLRHVPASSVVTDRFPEVARAHRLQVATVESPSSPVVRLGGTWSSYLESRSNHFRSELRRKRKKLDSCGRVQFSSVRQPDECEAALRDVLRIETDSWKERAGTSLRTGGSFAFFRALAHRCARRGWLRLWLLHLDGMPIAYLFGIVYRNEFHAIRTSFDQSFANASPGSVLFGHAIQEAFVEGLTAFNLQGGASRWKNEIANDARRHVNLCVFSSGAVRCRICRLVQGRVKPFLRSRTPRLIRMKRHLHRVLLRRR
jgi:CelD/BcsL family acetyltransferase involved in cellulose biosynthesis